MKTTPIPVFLVSVQGSIRALRRLAGRRADRRAHNRHRRRGGVGAAASAPITELRLVRWDDAGYVDDGGIEPVFPSTTWHWKDGSLRRGGAPEGHSRPGGPSVYKLRYRDQRKPLDLQVSYVGGAEGHWRIKARGWIWTFPGDLSVADVMRWINRAD